MMASRSDQRHSSASDRSAVAMKKPRVDENMKERERERDKNRERDAERAKLLEGRRERDDARSSQSHTYVAKQTAKERVQIRKKYRELIEKTTEDKNKLVLPSSDGILKVIEEGNKLFDSVKSSREAALDTELLTVVSQLAVEHSQRLAGGMHYDLETFIKNTSKFIQDSEGKDIDEKISSFSGDRCLDLFKTTVKRSFMYGPLQKEFQKKVVKPRAPKEKLEKRVRPENVKDTKFDEQTETSLRVQHVGSVLRKVTSDGENSINFWDLVLDPASFSKTAENIFHFSFLIKEGYAKVDEDNNIVPSSPTHGEVENKIRHQAIVRIDYDKWEKVKSDHNLTEATIPTFEPPSKPSQKPAKSSQKSSQKPSSQKPSQKSSQKSKKRKQSSSSESISS